MHQTLTADADVAGDLLVDAFHDRELVEINGRKFVINPLTEQIPATTPELLMLAAKRSLAATDLSTVDKIVGEEDKGGILVAAAAIASGLPFGLARWYPSGLQGQIAVDFTCEYAEGRVYLNGVEPGERVVIIDDLISTGGTMIALIQGIRQAGAEVADIVCVAEKVEYGGVQRVAEATGLHVKTLVRMSIAGDRAVVL